MDKLPCTQCDILVDEDDNEAWLDTEIYCEACREKMNLTYEIAAEDLVDEYENDMKLISEAEDHRLDNPQHVSKR